jgi:hypothetical protein
MADRKYYHPKLTLYQLVPDIRSPDSWVLLNIGEFSYREQLDRRIQTIGKKLRYIIVEHNIIEEK